MKKKKRMKREKERAGRAGEAERDRVEVCPSSKST